MKKLILALLLFSGSISAQQVNITGNIKNEQSQPVKAVTVTLYNVADSSLVKASVTDTAGQFRLAGIQPGKYYVVAKRVGYGLFRSAVYHVKSDVQLTLITLPVQNKQLGQVNVVAQKPLIDVMANKTVFNVQNSLSSTGLSAFEVLRKAPGVIVDNQNNVILEGKTGVAIFIDGKKSLLSGDDLTNYLKTLQSPDIEALEIITQPSSKYDAAGNAGIINIRLKKNKNYGTNGSFTAGYGIGRYSKYNSSVSINSRTDKFNFFSTYSNNFGKNSSYINLDRFQSGYEYNERSTNLSNDQNNNVRVGLDYSATKNSTLGVLLTGNFRGSNGTNNDQTPITDASGVTQQFLLAHNYSRLSNNNFTANLNYRYAPKKSQELTLDADYGYYTSDRNSLQPNYYYSGDGTILFSQAIYRMITPVDIHLFSLKADYSQPIGKTMLAIGFKTSAVKTNNVFNFYNVNGPADVYDDTRSNTFDYTENINAAYLNLGRSWKALSAQVGLRAEQTVSDGELTSVQQNQDGSVKRNYLDLFPSGGLTYAMNAKDNLSLNYSRRIERPDYRSLNPFQYNIDELSFSKGNPFLKPQYTSAIRLSNTYNYTLTTSLSYSYITDFFAQITDTLGTKRNFISPQNIANQQVIDLDASYAFNVSKWWSVYADVNAYRSFYASKNEKFRSEAQSTLSFYGSNSFVLPDGYRFEASGWFNSPSIWAGSYHTRSMGSLDLAMQKLFLGNKLSARLAVSDLLHTSNWSGTTQYGQLFIKGSGGYESRQLRLSLKYNFGSKTVKSADTHKSGVEEEKSRIQN